MNKLNGMKLLIFFTCATLLFSFNLPQDKNTVEEMVITGKIKNYDESKFEFSYDNYAFPIKHKTQKIKIDEEGNFKIKIQSESPIKGRLYFGRVMINHSGHNRYIYVFLEPGDSIHLTANVDVLSDLNVIEKTLSFSGSDVSDNIYVNQEDYLFNTYLQRRQNNQLFIEKKSPNDYKKTVDSIRDEKLSYLKEYAKKHGLSYWLYEISKIDYKKLAVIRKINYPSSNERFNDGKKATLPDDYYSFLKEVKISKNLDNKGMPYLRYLHFLLKNKYELGKADGNKEDYLQYVKSQLSGRPLYIYLAYSLRSDFRADTYRMFDKNCPYPDIAKVVHKKYGRFEKMLPGNPAPNVIFTTLTGEKTPLSKFKGNYVYIDCWATWCKPCIREIPDLVKLEEEYKDQHIKFISVSFDKKDKPWKDFVAKENLVGIQLWADNDNKDIIDDFFNILMIPRFILIDDKGKIVDANAPRPSSGKDIRNLLDKALSIKK